ncbi:MAG: PfaD family polyunsaturated fatty acid/polyketide biosynthesis protein, partial [Desulfuromonadaceae bacterium]|nr:PfaD family polyunsaturated fatty acid/polyketide biosynthesis protein [Desulfuromonadaceae bacterium]
MKYTSSTSALKGHSSAPALNFNHFNPIGTWTPTPGTQTSPTSLNTALRQMQRPVFLCRDERGMCQVHTDGQALMGTLPKTLKGTTEASISTQMLLAYAAPLAPHQCGDPEFLRSLGLRYAVIGGSMAKGISSAAMVKALGKAGMLGFLGSAGLDIAEVEAQMRELQSELDHDGCAYGCNLIHSPNEPGLEQELVDMYLRLGLNLIEASAFMQITAPLVEYRLHSIQRDATGTIIIPNKIIAKVSREEIATHFLSPPPAAIVAQLEAQGKISAAQAELAKHIPMADAVTAEADSGGHTDNRPALALFPTIVAVRDTLQQRYQYAQRPHIGLGGGIATPYAAAAAFAMGAAYLVTGSINQACVEAGTCPQVKQMLAEAQQADIAMAPAADMFEMGVDVQVLKRGTMFSMRAASLYELYRKHESIEQIPATERTKLEKTIFKASLDEVWNSTRSFFAQRDPRELERANADPKHKMALMFRSYLGQATHWAIEGNPKRRMDYQIWCGPAMPA